MNHRFQRHFLLTMTKASRFGTFHGAQVESAEKMEKKKTEVKGGNEKKGFSRDTMEESLTFMREF